MAYIFLLSQAIPYSRCFNRIILTHSSYFPFVRDSRRFLTADTRSGRSNSISIPYDKLEISFARSSGPGGQNVNKVNTKAELRFNVIAADWLPEDVKSRLLTQQSNRINKDGELIITSQEYRYVTCMLNFVF